MHKIFFISAAMAISLNIIASEECIRAKSFINKNRPDLTAMAQKNRSEFEPMNDRQWYRLVITQNRLQTSLNFLEATALVANDDFICRMSLHHLELDFNRLKNK